MKNPYVHTKGIDLRKCAPFFVSRIDGEFVYEYNVDRVFENCTNKHIFVFQAEGDETKYKRTYEVRDFYEIHRRYDYKSSDYWEVLNKLQKRVSEKMTIRVFNRNKRTYPMTFLQTYDLVSDPGYKSIIGNDEKLQRMKTRNGGPK